LRRFEENEDEKTIEKFHQRQKKTDLCKKASKNNHIKTTCLRRRRRRRIASFLQISAVSAAAAALSTGGLSVFFIFCAFESRNILCVVRTLIHIDTRLSPG